MNNLVPIGVIGELCIGGVPVVPGYLNRTELTHAKFIEDHISGRAGARLYRSGDLARRLADGKIEYLGRVDDQVKIRGYRIELGGIEQRLNELEEVQDAVVLVQKDQFGHNRLFAYVVPSRGVDEGYLQAELSKRLPSFMIPEVWIQLESLPLKANGKVDKQQLSKIERQQARKDLLIPPGNELEAKIADAWKEILGIEEVGIQDNFFKIGGNSILAVKLAKRLQKTIDSSISVMNLFQYVSIQSLATFLQSQDASPLIERSAEDLDRIKQRQIPLANA